MLLIHDLRVGWRRGFVRWIMAALLLSFIGGMAYRTCAMGSWKIRIWDLIIWIFQGEPPYVMSRESTFKLPVVVFLFQLYLFFCVSGYPLQDLEQEGQKYILLGQSRIRWWLAKCTWIVVAVVMYYLVLIGILEGILLIFGNKGNGVLALMEYAQFSAGFSSMQLFPNAILLPMLVSIAMALLQFMLSLLYSLQLSYLVTVSLLVISVYWFNPYLPGNYMMLLRNDLLTSPGMNVWQGCIWAASVSLCSVVIGACHIRKRNILSGRNT